MNSKTGSNRSQVLPERAFALLGGDRIAYLKSVESGEVSEMFPQAPALKPGMKLWALLSADGTPIMLTDSKDAAIAGARENELETVSVH